MKLIVMYYCILQTLDAVINECHLENKKSFYHTLKDITEKYEYLSSNISPPKNNKHRVLVDKSRKRKKQLLKCIDSFNVSSKNNEISLEYSSQQTASLPQQCDLICKENKTPPSSLEQKCNYKIDPLLINQADTKLNTNKRKYKRKKNYLNLKPNRKISNYPCKKINSTKTLEQKILTSEVVNKSQDDLTSKCGTNTIGKNQTKSSLLLTDRLKVNDIKNLDNSSLTTVNLKRVKEINKIHNHSNKEIKSLSRFKEKNVKDLESKKLPMQLIENENNNSIMTRSRYKNLISNLSKKNKTEINIKEKEKADKRKNYAQETHVKNIWELSKEKISVSRTANVHKTNLDQTTNKFVEKDVESNVPYIKCIDKLSPFPSGKKLVLMEDCSIHVVSDLEILRNISLPKYKNQKASNVTSNVTKPNTLNYTPIGFPALIIDLLTQSSNKVICDRDVMVKSKPILNVENDSNNLEPQNTKASISSVTKNEIINKTKMSVKKKLNSDKDNDFNIIEENEHNYRQNSTLISNENNNNNLIIETNWTDNTNNTKKTNSNINFHSFYNGNTIPTTPLHPSSLKILKENNLSSRKINLAAQLSSQILDTIAENSINKVEKSPKYILSKENNKKSSISSDHISSHTTQINARKRAFNTIYNSNINTTENVQDVSNENQNNLLQNLDTFAEDNINKIEKNLKHFLSKEIKKKFPISINQHISSHPTGINTRKRAFNTIYNSSISTEKVQDSWNENQKDSLQMPDKCLPSKLENKLGVTLRNQGIIDLNNLNTINQSKVCATQRSNLKACSLIKNISRDNSNNESYFLEPKEKVRKLYGNIVHIKPAFASKAKQNEPKFNSNNYNSQNKSNLSNYLDKKIPRETSCLAEIQEEISYSLFENEEISEDATALVCNNTFSGLKRLKHKVSSSFF